MSAIETLGVTLSSVGFDDCACPKPAVVTLDTGLAPRAEDDCACPDVAQVGIKAETVFEAPAMAQPAKAPAIKVNVVVPQA